MKRSTAAIGSSLFFAVAPGIVAGLIPWWLSRWSERDPMPYGAWLQVAGALLVLLGVPVLLHAFARFVVEGLGTPAPVAPTQHLVVGGLFRWVRNPMYLAVWSVIGGQALLFASAWTAVWLALVVAATMGFVRLYEEPTLRATFGQEYDDYMARVPRWLPRPPG
jgi:protein-S-isoprenylcysteine O-methyltransferase Ste14